MNRLSKVLGGLAILASITVFGALVYAKNQIEPVTPELLQKKVDDIVNSKKAVGIIIAHVTPTGTTIVSAGETKLGNGIKPTENTIFEVASVTKALTGTVLSQAVLDGKINDQDLAQKYLKTLTLPAGPITVATLATQSSGIPTVDMEYITSLKPEDQLNPWAKYDNAVLQKFLDRTKLEFEPGTKFSYSNIGAGIVGQLLSNVYGKSYEELMTELLFAPLGMTDTGIMLSDDQLARTAQGYFSDGKKFEAIGIWGFGDLPAAGAVRSTVKDMTTLAKALVDESKPVSKAFNNATQIKNSKLDQKIGYFWILSGSMPVAWHNGATYGMESYFAIHKKKKEAIIIFANTSEAVATPLTDIGTLLMMGIDNN